MDGGSTMTPEQIEWIQSEAKYCASRASLENTHAGRNYWIGKQHGYENVIELLITKQPDLGDTKT